MIRNIFLDADDTLLDFRCAERDALRETLLHFSVQPTLTIPYARQPNFTIGNKLPHKSITSSVT